SPSYHRDWTGISMDPVASAGQPNDYKYWFVDDPARPWLKYTVLRPRPADHPSVNGKPGLSGPEDRFGDARNRPPGWGPPGNDSPWLYTGAPVLRLPDGRLYTMMFAPLIVDLDSKLNVNAHGNIAAAGAPAGSQG